MDKLKKITGKKLWTGFVIIGLLLPYLQALFTGLPKQVVAETGEQTLVNKEGVVSVSSHYEIAGDTVNWVVDYNKAPSQNNRKLFFKVEKSGATVSTGSIKQNGNLVDTNLQEATGWMGEKDYSAGETSGSFTVPAQSGETLKLSVQVEEQVVTTVPKTQVAPVAETTTSTSGETVEEAPVAPETEEVTSSENLLSQGESGPYDLVAEIPETETSTTESAVTETTTSEVPAEESTASSEATEESTVESTVDSSGEFVMPAIITPGVRAAGDAGSLIISDKAMNTASSMEVSVTGKPATTTKIEYGEKPLEDYSGGLNNLQNNIYKFYLEGSGKVGVLFDKYSLANRDDTPDIDWDYNEHALDGATVSVKYPFVGYLNDEQGNLNEIGAIVTVSDIVIPRSVTGRYGDWWLKDGSTAANPGIDFSTNLFSGIYLSGIYSVKINFQFVDKKTGSVIDFSNAQNPFITFSSLNGYGTNSLNGEFVGSDSVPGKTIGSESLINKTTVSPIQINNSQLVPAENVYTSTNGDGRDYDNLGNPGFNKLAVTFPLQGASNTFNMGTGGGATYGGWFTFASSAIVPVKQSSPAKTVQPINQYKENDTWDKPTGTESGFEQRFWNDLDRYNDGGGTWDLLEQYRVQGHDAETPSELLPGIPEKADRYVQTDQEYFYFINQPTINLVSQGLVLPKGYEITDTLPAGVEYEDFTVYDQSGEPIPNSNFEFNRDGQKLTFTANSNAVDKINELSKDKNYYGKDFSIRIKVKVTNTVNDNISDLMENEASSKFAYDNVSYDATSNKVHTKIKAPLKISFTKVDDFGENLAGAEFGLYASPYTEGDEPLQTATSGTDGKVNFPDEIASGTYVIHEISAPGVFTGSEDITIVVNSDGSITWPEGYDSTNPQVVNSKGYNLTLTKNNQYGLAMKDVEFTLKEEGSSDILATVTTDAQGQLIISGGLLQKGKTYTLEETTPDGYVTGNIWTIIISEDGKTATIQKNSEASINLVVNTDVKNDEYYEITGGDKGTLENTLKPFDVTLTKVDKVTGNPLGNAIFEIRDKNNFGTDDDSTYIGEGTSGVDGKITFKVKGTENAYELEAGKTYYVKEKTPPDGYELLEKVFEIVIEKDGTVKVDGTKQENVLIGGNEHNHIDLGTVDNQPKNHLPETGGNGTRNFLIAGWISIIFAGISLIYVYNKNKGVA